MYFVDVTNNLYRLYAKIFLGHITEKYHFLSSSFVKLRATLKLENLYNRENTNSVTYLNKCNYKKDSIALNMSNIFASNIT